MKKYIYYLLTGAIIGLGSCADDSDDVGDQARQQLAEQQQIIEAYLADSSINATRDGDIFYQVLTENASGEAPKQGDIIRIYYQISSLDGTVIDQHLAADSVLPVTYVFNTGNLILPALDFSINKMKTGEEYEFYLPTAYSYVGYSLGNTIAEDEIVRARIQLVDIITLDELQEEENERIQEYLATSVLGVPDSIGSGVYYVRTREGDASAAELSNGNIAQVRYTGSLLDGTEFDSNVNAATPLPVTIGGTELLPGFERGIAQMKLNEKGVIIIPSLQAYQQSSLAFPVEIIQDLAQQGLIDRSQSIGANIPPFSPLRFDVEVVSVN